MFTYKKTIHEGRYRSFEPEQHEIKLKGKVVGSISEAFHTSGRTGFGVSFAVSRQSTKENPAPFRWLYLKTRFKDAAEAKAFLRQHFDNITGALNLYSFEDRWERICSMKKSLLMGFCIIEAILMASGTVYPMRPSSNG